MSVADPEPITITVEDGIDVSGLLQAPPRARACFVLAHGAGAGMAHPVSYTHLTLPTILRV